MQMSNKIEKNEIKRINLSLTKDQYGLIKMLRGEMGNTDAEIARNILLSWFSEKSFISSKVKKKLGLK